MFDLLDVPIIYGRVMCADNSSDKDNHDFNKTVFYTMKFIR